MMSKEEQRAMKTRFDKIYLRFDETVQPEKITSAVFF